MLQPRLIRTSSLRASGRGTKLPIYGAKQCIPPHSEEIDIKLVLDARPMLPVPARRPGLLRTIFGFTR